MSISIYFRPNIHQNGPEILGVKNHLNTIDNVYLHQFGGLLSIQIIKSIHMRTTKV
jgi:hypothetical protein